MAVLACRCGASAFATSPFRRTPSRYISRRFPNNTWRTTPTQKLTDRVYAGHLENMELGLVYMNARYYVLFLNPTGQRVSESPCHYPKPQSPATPPGRAACTPAASSGRGIMGDATIYPTLC